MHKYRKYLVIVTLSAISWLPVWGHSADKPGLDTSGHKKILILGDSLSAAYKLAAEDGWVHLLQARIDRDKLPFKVVNASVSGATTAAGLQMLPSALSAHQPAVVLIELGANDGLQGKPVPYISRNLTTLITQSQDAGAKVVLAGIRLPPNFGSRYTKPFFDQYAILAKQFELPLVPFLLSGVAGNADLMLRDGLHPKAKAQPLVLDNVWPIIEPLLQK
ncbi:MAG: arylesterase [Agarilytica sp.]